MLMSQNGLGRSTNNAEEEEMKQLKAKEMYLRARLSVVKRQEETMMRICQEKNTLKETHQQRNVRGQSETISSLPLSDDVLSDDVFLSICSNQLLPKEQQEKASIVSNEFIQSDSKRKYWYCTNTTR